MVPLLLESFNSRWCGNINEPQQKRRPPQKRRMMVPINVMWIIAFLSAILIHLSSWGRYSGITLSSLDAQVQQQQRRQQQASLSSSSLSDHRPTTSTTSLQQQVGSFQKPSEVYYINLDKNIGRRTMMESWLSSQSKPYQRVPALKGNPNVCASKKTNGTNACMGLSGLAMTVVNLIDTILQQQQQHVNTSTTDDNNVGISNNTSSAGRLRAYPGDESVYVLEDDYFLNFTVANEFVSKYIPNDWDIVRFNPWLWNPIPPTFRKVNPHVVRNSHEGKQCNNTNNNSTLSPITSTTIVNSNTTSNIIKKANNNNNNKCLFCGGTHAMLWRISSLPKLRKLWSQQPYGPIDCRLNTESINGYLMFLDKPVGQHVGNKGSEHGYMIRPQNDISDVSRAKG